MRTYIVRKGDTLSEISKRVLGDPYRYSEIASYNRLLSPHKLSEGQTLFFPSQTIGSVDPSLHTVRYGDTLWKISERTTGNPNMWNDIARLNQLRYPNQLFVGQVLKLPPHMQRQSHVKLSKEQQPIDIKIEESRYEQEPATTIPGEGFFYIVSDEKNPFRSKLVRKDHPHLNPPTNGFQPKDMNSKVTIGRHVQGMNNSRYISTSTKPFGLSRFNGSRYWIDVEILKKDGVKIFTHAEIELDLQRIESKYGKDPKTIQDVAKARSHLRTDGFSEVLVEGPIKPQAIKGAPAMIITRSTQTLQGVGLIVSAYQIKSAAQESYETGSIKPIEKESIKQAFGWTGSTVGSLSAVWAGARLGAITGVSLGIETGPGMLITGLIGSIVGGFLGYWGGEWVAGCVDEYQ